MLDDWRQYGESVFAFSVLHEVSEPYAGEMMRVLEIAYIHQRQPTYNRDYPPGYVLIVRPLADASGVYQRMITGETVCPLRPRTEPQP